VLSRCCRDWDGVVRRRVLDYGYNRGRNVSVNRESLEPVCRYINIPIIRVVGLEELEPGENVGSTDPKILKELSSVP
jgi:hypothetical protein